jgi:predicted cupin superfamily sugar epimerase
LFFLEVDMITAEQIKALLDLETHPKEGGFFTETYRAGEQIPQATLPDRYDGSRSLATAIYYLLTPETFSAMHRLQSDEIFHFYLGDPVEMLQLQPDGSGRVLILGPDILGGMRPQLVVSKGVWQGARVCPGGGFALMGATVSPGFEYRDYETGRSAELMRAYPEFRELIAALTP